MGVIVLAVLCATLGAIVGIAADRHFSRVPARADLEPCETLDELEHGALYRWFPDKADGPTRRYLGRTTWGGEARYWFENTNGSADGDYHGLIAMDRPRLVGRLLLGEVVAWKGDAAT